MDGAVGLTQNPIPAGGSFTYNFTVGEEEFGTFWYHGHEKTQRDDGLYGGFVVHRPLEQLDEKETYNYDEEILLLVGDWYHRPSTEVLAWYMNSRSFGNEPVPDSLLVNGKGSFDCAMAVPARPVECIPHEERQDLPLLQLQGDKRYRLRLVNTGSLTGFSFTMDNASLSPFQLDGGNAISIAETQSIGIIYPGERADAVLAISACDGERHVRIEMDDENFKYPNPALNPAHTFPVTTSSVSDGESPFTGPELIHYNLQAATASVINPEAFSSKPLKFVIYTTTLKLAKHHNIPMGFINPHQLVPAIPAIDLIKSAAVRQEPAYTTHSFLPERYCYRAVNPKDGLRLSSTTLTTAGIRFICTDTHSMSSQYFHIQFPSVARSLLSPQGVRACTTTIPSRTHHQIRLQAHTPW